MGTPARTAHHLLAVLVLALLSSLPLVAVSTVPAAAAIKGTVTGQVIAQGNVPLRMRWFDKEWNYLDQRKVDGDIYSLSVPPGTYYLQFVDLRPAYHVDKYAPTDLKVTVRRGKTVQRDVRLRVGAAITGTVRGGGRALAGARVVAANAHEQSFETRANRQGQFAVGGLPDGHYSVFTYDRQAQWVGRSTYVRGLASRQRRHVAIALDTRAGSLRVELRADGRKVKQRAFVTAVSKSSGQFWTVKASRGVAIFEGLFPGGYTMVAPGVGSFLPQSAAIKNARVRSGGADLASTFTWTKRGASAQGFVVDADHPDLVLEGARVTLYAADGTQLGSARTDGEGQFFVSGPIPTQKGVVAVVEPDPRNGSAYLGEKPYRCEFDRLEVGAVSLTQGSTTQLGDLLLPYLPVEEQSPDTPDPNCAPAQG